MVQEIRQVTCLKWRDGCAYLVLLLQASSNGNSLSPLYFSFHTPSSSVFQSEEEYDPSEFEYHMTQRSENLLDEWVEFLLIGPTSPSSFLSALCRLSTINSTQHHSTHLQPYHEPRTLLSLQAFCGSVVLPSLRRLALFKDTNWGSTQKSPTPGLWVARACDCLSWCLFSA